MASSPIPLGEVIANKYRIDEVLGEGGMGVVVAAHHLELDQRVAIKFLLGALAENAEGAERFRREARAAAKIQSDHVVRVLDVGVLDSGERYMVMECLDGHDLAQELSNQKTIPMGIATGYILEALDAVNGAHKVDIVHRDLKPANLFLTTRSDGKRRVKVLDFGISKSVGGSSPSEMSLTRTSAWIGSPLYMAPEQMESARAVDARADVWSLGAILYEMISGKTPYVADSLPQLCNLLMTTDPVPISSHCPDIPEGLADAIMSCLVRDRSKRTQTALELAHALHSFAARTTGSGVNSLIFESNSLRGESHSIPSGLTTSKPMSAAPRSDGVHLAQHTKNGHLPGGEMVSRRTQDSSAVQAASHGQSLHDGTMPSAPLPGNSTHSAWGGTDQAPHKKTSNKTALIFSALALAGVAVFFFTGSLTKGETESADEPMIVANDAPINAGNDPHPPQHGAATATRAAASAAGSPEMSSKNGAATGGGSGAENDAPSNVQTPPPVENANSGVEKHTSASRAASSTQASRPARPRPRPRVAPRSKPAARPAPSPPVPSPPPAPTPTPKDEFSDFGGRR